MGPDLCFSDLMFQAEWTGCTSCQESHWDGFHPDPSSVRKGHLHFARVIHVPTWVASCCPHGDAVMGRWWVIFWGFFRVSCWCPFPEALAYLGSPLVVCMVEAKSPGHWGRTRHEHQSLEPLPIFSSPAISRLLGLFQLLGEEVSGKAHPDVIYFHGSRKPFHALC